MFRGQLIRMHFPREFLGVTIVRRDAGVFNVFGGGELDGRKLERVRLVASEFEKAFEVWGTDQVEARYLLHPVMMERLIELEKGLHGKRLRCGFENGDLLVAVEGGNLFEPGDLFKPLVDPARARRIINEIAGVVKVMDQVRDGAKRAAAYELRSIIAPRPASSPIAMRLPSALQASAVTGAFAGFVQFHAHLIGEAAPRAPRHRHNRSRAFPRSDETPQRSPALRARPAASAALPCGPSLPTNGHTIAELAPEVASQRPRLSQEKLRVLDG